MRPRTSLVRAGAVMFGVGHGLSTLAGALMIHYGSRGLPWLQLAGGLHMIPVVGALIPPIAMVREWGSPGFGVTVASR